MTAGHSQITALAIEIAKNTAIIDEYLTSNGLPAFSFGVDAPLYDEPFPPPVQDARFALDEATLELRELILGPRRLLMEATLNYRVDLDTIVRFDIFNKVPVTGSISYVDLSKQIGLELNALCKVMRSVIVHRVFAEPEHGFVAHSAASKLVVEDELLAQWLLVGVRDMTPALKKLGEALEKWPEAQEIDRTGSALAFVEKDGELRSHYDYLNRDPTRAKRFAAAMELFQKGPRFSLHHLAERYNWSSLPVGATVVDVGGSHGSSALAIATKAPHLKFVVQDTPPTIQSAPSIPAHFNIELMEHDFFTPQPVHGASVYFLRWIFHNWPDKYCIRILQNLIPALILGSRVLIMDEVIQPLGEATIPNERDTRMMELSMLALFNAGGREESGWKRIFERADARFRFLGARDLEGSHLSFVEAVWEG